MGRPTFRVQSHVLALLGDQLIGHDRLAIFELVKNAYDADAQQVDITLNLNSASPSISIKDDGCGMSLFEIENYWLEVGTDSKRGKERKRSDSIFDRLPLGEKGVGRLAVQKLGSKIRMVTRKTGHPEYEITIDWHQLISSSKYLDGGLEVDITTKPAPTIFKDSTGTLLEITNLNRADWKRAELRDLYRLVISLSNPFDEVRSFKVSLEVPGRESDFADLPKVKDMLDSATWVFEFALNENAILDWKYKFRPPRFKDLKPSEAQGNGKLELVSLRTEKKKSDDSDIFLPAERLVGIGPIKGQIYAFHRRPEILREAGSIKQIKDWLKAQTGVRVYRDKVRVFNYGEPGNDWLGLNAIRINRPSGRLGTDGVIAHVDLELDKSYGLKEKTNREGFDENKNYEDFSDIVLSIFDKFQRIHWEDRQAVDAALKGSETPTGLGEAINSIERIAKKHKIESELKPAIKSIKNEMENFQNMMVNAGMAGINLSLAFHEMVHGVDALSRQLEANVDSSTLRKTIDHLRKLLDTFKPLLERERARKVHIKDLLSRALGMHESRFPRHNLVLSNRAIGADGTESFYVTGPLNLLVGAISNVIDNAIYWARYKRERDNLDTPGAVLVFTSWGTYADNKEGIIAIVDNGPGFQLPLQKAATPFLTTRAGGMGLGLYFAKLVMDSMEAKLEVVHAQNLRDEFEIPEAYDGTAVVFRFKDKK